MRARGRICAACGAANAPNVAFCGTCAAPLTTTALARRPPARPPVLARQRGRDVALAVGVGAVVVRLGVWAARHAIRLLLARARRAWEEGPSEAPAPWQPRARVRRFWAVGDAGGLRRWGLEETVVDEWPGADHGS